MCLLQLLAHDVLVQVRQPKVMPLDEGVGRNGAQLSRRIRELVLTPATLQLRNQHPQIEWEVVADQPLHTKESALQLRQNVNEAWLAREVVIREAGDLRRLCTDLLAGMDQRRPLVKDSGYTICGVYFDQANLDDLR